MLNSWHYIGYTYSPGTIKTYKDGILIDSKTLTFASIISPKLTLFSNRVGSQSFAGRAEELAIWNRTLSASDVTALFNKGSTKLGVKYRTCAASDCSGAVWSDLNYSPRTVIPINDANRYFQYSTQFDYIDFPYAIVNYTATFGSTVNVVHSDYGDEVDNISSDVQLTRGSCGGLYNAAVSGDSDYTGWYCVGAGISAPANTEWNVDGWDDLNNVSSRSYTGFILAAGDGGGYGVGAVVGKELILHDIPNDTYYKIMFSSWTQGGGGGFVYDRTPITLMRNPDIIVHTKRHNAYSMFKDLNLVYIQ